jgi:outer membrane protein assembly factor BamB
MFHDDVTHLGVSGASLGSVWDLGPLWSTKIGTAAASTGGAVVSSPIVADGDVYAAGADGSISAYSASGAKLWSKKLGTSPIIDTPAYDNGKVFVEEGGTLYSLTASSGKKNWSVSVGSNESSPSVVNGQVFVAPENGYEYSYKESSGSLIWSGKLQFNATYNSPTVGGGLVYTGDTSCVINALKESTGKEVWALNYDEANIDATVAYTGDAITGGSDGDYVFSRTASNGASLWETSVTGGVESSPAVFQPTIGHPIAVFGTDAGLLYGVGPIFSSPAVSSDGIAVVGTEQGDLFAVNVVNGSLLWRYHLTSGITSSPAITTSGVYVTGSDGYLYLFGHTGQTAPESGTAIGSGAASKDYKPCAQGDYPVDCASGDFWHTFTDVSIPGRGPELDLTRTYNSLSAVSEGIFGYGWTSSYEWHLTQNGDGSVTVTENDGSQVTAQPNGDGGYTVPSWADSTLTVAGGG